GLASSTGRGLGFVRLEIDGGGINAVAQAARAGAVLEDVAQVGAALLTHDLRADHEVAAVYSLLDVFRHCRGVEAGPAAARIELCLGTKQGRAAAAAVVVAGGPRIPVFAGEGPLG